MIHSMSLRMGRPILDCRPELTGGLFSTHEGAPTTPGIPWVPVFEHPVPAPSLRTFPAGLRDRVFSSPVAPSSELN
jgi:hypothetical protein